MMTIAGTLTRIKLHNDSGSIIQNSAHLTSSSKNTLQPTPMKNIPTADLIHLQPFTGETFSFNMINNSGIYQTQVIRIIQNIYLDLLLNSSGLFKLF